jgi:hypothetical protein
LMSLVHVRLQLARESAAHWTAPQTGLWTPSPFRHRLAL